MIRTTRCRPTCLITPLRVRRTETNGIDPALVSSPYISPAGPALKDAEGIFTGFLPTFISTGGNELFYDEIFMELERRMTRDHIRVTNHIEEDGVHICSADAPEAAERTYSAFETWVHGLSAA